VASSIRRAVLRGAPCLLLPFHVMGSLENAANTRVVLRLPGQSSEWGGATAAVVEVEVRPSRMLLHSPPPPPGRALP